MEFALYGRTSKKKKTRLFTSLVFLFYGCPHISSASIIRR